MKATLKGLAAGAVALATSTFAAAQTTPLACQTEAAAGLSWKAGRWQVSRFEDRNFILIQDGKVLRSEPVAKALFGAFAECQPAFGDRISCTDGIGGYMIFDPKTRRGTISQGIGGTVTTIDKRDSLTVSPFECQPF